jgi:hypothetical protein
MIKNWIWKRKVFFDDLRSKKDSPYLEWPADPAGEKWPKGMLATRWKDGRYPLELTYKGDTLRIKIPKKSSKRGSFWIWTVQTLK